MKLTREQTYALGLLAGHCSGCHPDAWGAQPWSWPTLSIAARRDRKRAIAHATLDALYRMGLIVRLGVAVEKVRTQDARTTIDPERTKRLGDLYLLSDQGRIVADRLLRGLVETQKRKRAKAST